MALNLANRVQETTTTTGTGTITLAGAVSGYQSFAAIGNGNTTYYTLTSGTDWEVGIGTYTSSGTTLARTTILSSSAAGAAITLAGTSTVFVDYPAEKAISNGFGTLPVLNGGTGQTTYTNGQLLIGNTTGNTLTKATLGQGTGITITNAAGAITIAATNTGTVTSVGQSFTGGLISVSGSPITASGTLALTVAGTSGGIPYFSSASTWATSAALALNALVVGGGAAGAPATVTTGTNVLTALGVAVGSAGALVTNGGVLGTPSSGTVTNLTGTASININGTVGATTATTGAFTTLAASSTVSGTGFTNYFASPPALGGTAAAAVSSTALSYTTTLTGGTGIVNLGSGQFYKDASGNVGIGTTTPSSYGKLAVLSTSSGGIGHFETSATSLSNAVIRTTSTTGYTGLSLSSWSTWTTAKNVGQIRFDGLTSTGSYTEYAGIYADAGTNTATGAPTILSFTTSAGAGSLERMRIDNTGTVGIGTTAPAATALLDVQSTTKGVRFPNMTTTQKNAISSPALGLVIFDTTLAKLCVYTGSWQTITSA